MDDYTKRKMQEAFDRRDPRKQLTERKRQLNAIIASQEEDDETKKESAKELDCLVRGIRIEEIPLVKKKHKEKVQMDRERYEQETIKNAEIAKKQWGTDVQDKMLLECYSVFSYISALEEAVMTGRKIKHEARCRQAEREALVTATKAKFKRARRRRDEDLERQTEEAYVMV